MNNIWNNECNTFESFSAVRLQVRYKMTYELYL